MGTRVVGTDRGGMEGEGRGKEKWKGKGKERDVRGVLGVREKGQ